MRNEDEEKEFERMREEFLKKGGKIVKVAQDVESDVESFKDEYKKWLGR